MGSLYVCLSLILSLYFLAKHFLRRNQNLPPSPFPTLPLLGHLHLLKNPLHRTLSKFSGRYGPVLLLRLGSRTVLLVSSPATAEECFTKNDVVFANRPRLLAGKHLGNNYSTLVWAPYGDHWRNLRRIAVVELFAAHRLQTLSEIRADEVKSLLGRLSRNCGDNKDVDMKMAFFEMMLNVMMRMIAGKSFYGEKVVETEEARHFQEIVVETFRVAGNNNADFLPFLCWFGGFEKRVMALKEKRNNFSQGLIEEIRKKKAEFGDSDDYKGKEKTMVDVLLSLQETEPEYYTDETIRGIMTVVLSAGTDTSVGTMEWTLSLLLNHPCILKKAQKEIDEQKKKKLAGAQCGLRLPLPSPAAVDMAEEKPISDLRRAAPLLKQKSWSPDAYRDQAWERRRRCRSRRSRSVTDEDLDELKGCIELGFGFGLDSPEAEPRLSDTFPALGLYYAVNRQYYDAAPKSSSLFSMTSSAASECESPMGSPHTIFSPGDNPETVKTRLRQWAQVVACSVRQSSRT